MEQAQFWALCGNDIVIEKMSTIWQVPAYLPYVQPALTEAAIREAESSIGYKLPQEYIEILSIQNGGYIRLGLKDLPHDTIAGIGPYFPSLTDFDWDEVREYVSFELDGLVPFDGDGHWQLCLDYREDENCPSVIYIDIECDSEGPVIADSFREYLLALELEIEDDLVLLGGKGIKEIKTILAQALDSKFLPSDDSDHGYPEERIRLGTDENPEWVWISPNSVNRGFVRKGEPRYKKLRKLMAGKALRYPELPHDSYILSTTEGIRQEVVDACIQSGLEIEPVGEFLKDT